jgi:hypothetical protein
MILSEVYLATTITFAGGHVETLVSLYSCITDDIEASCNVNCKLSARAFLQQAIFHVLCSHLDMQQYGWPHLNLQNCIAMALNIV